MTGFSLSLTPFSLTRISVDGATGVGESRPLSLLGVVSARVRAVADLGDGVYVSRVDSDAFEVEESVGGFTHMLFDDGAASVGLWQPGSDVGDWPKTGQLSARETIVVLAGSVRIEIEDGPTLDLGVGDIASMPKGAVTTWHPSADFKEIWIYS